MSRKIFTEEQQQLLRQNPYVYSVSASRMQLTREFKEIFLAVMSKIKDLNGVGVSKKTGLH